MTQQITFKFLTYNIYLRPPLLNARGNDYKNKRLNQMLRYEIDKYDIIIFQELWGTYSLRRYRCVKTAEKHGFLYHKSLHRRLYPIYYCDGGVTILSKYPILQTEQLIYSRGCCQDAFSAKGLLYAKIQIGNENEIIHVFGTHVQADYHDTRERNAKTRRYRTVQLKECFDFIKAKTQHDNHPILFAGDLNIDGGSLEYDELIQFIQSERYHYQAKDILFDQHQEHLCTHNDMIDGHKVDEVITSIVNETGRPNRLDYIFLLNEENRQQLEYKDCNVNKFPSHNNAPFPFLSDHYGIETEIIYHQSF